MVGECLHIIISIMAEIFSDHWPKTVVKHFKTADWWGFERLKSFHKIRGYAIQQLLEGWYSVDAFACQS